MAFEKFPSIGQFSVVCKSVRDNAGYHNENPPVLTATGTVKLHGTNAAVCTDGKTTWLQTRERILPENESHMGFREFYTRNKEEFARMFDRIREVRGDVDNEHIQIYGEWAGNGIQKGVGLVHCKKFFAVFAISTGTGENVKHWSPKRIAAFFPGLADWLGSEEIVSIMDFPNWELEIDFNKPTLVQNTLVDLTMAVEAECPVAKARLGDQEHGELIGEGIVWSIETPRHGLQRFKVKGEKHSTSKVKTIASVDPELVKSIDEFVEYAATEARMSQGIDKLREMGLDPEERKNIGAYVKWVVGDALREEMETLAASGLEAGQVTGEIGKRASAYIRAFQEQILV
ncbi:RNA ligase [Acidovorax phage ACP17]|uniref:RNA ligase 2 n=1 Tax=Acidovorax phage ACP17 TaxID=2010329 RepID=A0A218M3C0_9CAUD|nr:RNA ligase [Acidovorax phage ACP17]ASD50537.1 RNA ligase 2 [Acidovorax phage ACP17]